MWLLATLAVVAVWFALLVWCGTAIARVEARRHADDHRMIVAVRRHDQQEADQP